MDLNAPIIIVPEEYVVEDHIGSDVSNRARSITTNNCRHLVVDAGHISVISQLGNKEAIKEFLENEDVRNMIKYATSKSLLYFILFFFLK